MTTSRTFRLLAPLIAGSLLLLGAQSTPASAQDVCGHDVHGRIGDKYAQYAASLGCAQTDEIPLPDGVGRRQVFDHGTIYWSPNTDAHPVWGLIGAKWGALGYEGGSLHYPTSDEIRLPDGKGVRQVFQGGSVYWSPNTGAHPVWGLIGQRWGGQGWERGPYGYPITDELDLEGKTQMFENGPIRWSPNESENPLWSKAYATLLNGNPAAGDLNETGNLLPGGVDRGVVLVRGYIGDDGSVTNQVIGNHRQWSTDPAAGSKVTLAWDTATGHVGFYVEKSCINNLKCHDAMPIVRTLSARDVEDGREHENKYWVEPYGNGGIRIDISAVNAFVDEPGYKWGDLGRINATWYLTPHGYDGNNKTFTGFDLRTTKDKFPSYEVLRYPRLTANSSEPQGHWLGAVWQTQVSDLKAPQHTCTLNNPDGNTVMMGCSG